MIRTADHTGPARACARARHCRTPVTASTVTTASSPSMTQPDSAVPIAEATDVACAQATCRPDGSAVAAAWAARSAAACARCRAMTTAPTTAIPMVTATSTPTMAAPISVAEPRSSLTGFDGGHRFGGDGDTGQQWRFRADPGHDERTVAPQRHHRTPGADPFDGRGPIGAARGQSRRLPRRVDTAHLHAQRGEAGRTEHQNRHQCGDRERGLDRDRPVIGAQTLVLSARVMMLDSAVTMESPVTTE